MIHFESIESLPSPVSMSGGVFSSGSLVQKAFDSMRKQIKSNYLGSTMRFTANRDSCLHNHLQTKGFIIAEIRYLDAGIGLRG